MREKQPHEYPQRSLTPEHDARDGGDHGFNKDGPLHPEIIAAHDYVESVLDTSDFAGEYAWYGWGIREAFLAGISYAKKAHNDVFSGASRRSQK